MPAKGHRTPVTTRFWKRVVKTGPDDCWVWTGAVHRTGYGVITDDDGRQVRTHRLSYRLEHGTVPAHLCVCHSCDNRRCVNPSHLWLGTIADNNRDRDEKGRAFDVRNIPNSRKRRGDRHPLRQRPELAARGERITRARLTEAKVIEIFYLRSQGWTQQAIADRMGVKQAGISKVLRRTVWRHVDVVSLD